MLLENDDLTLNLGFPLFGELKGVEQLGEVSLGGLLDVAQAYEAAHGQHVVDKKGTARLTVVEGEVVLLESSSDLVQTCEASSC